MAGRGVKAALGHEKGDIFNAVKIRGVFSQAGGDLLQSFAVLGFLALKNFIPKGPVQGRGIIEGAGNILMVHELSLIHI